MFSWVFFENLFFSSRRRHTRSLCDWSSDVCSSDLACSTSCVNPASPWRTSARNHAGLPARSEERRAGKEGSVRWALSRFVREQDVGGLAPSSTARGQVTHVEPVAAAVAVPRRLTNA